MKPKIKIYSTKSCPYCVAAKKYFSENGLEYEEIDLTGKYAEMDELIKKTGFRTVPQIFVDNKFVGGYSDLLAKIQSGELSLAG